MSWRRDHANCNSIIINGGSLIDGLNINCQYGCSAPIGSLNYFCTEFSSNDNWSFGSNVITYDLFNAHSGDIITIGGSFSGWITPFAGSNVSTTFNLMPRDDTGEINSSPHAVSLPLRLQSGCPHTIPMAVSDPDGDVVRCRWAVGKECDSVCNAIPGAVLNSDTCTITYWANRGTGYKAVAVMVEDFIPGSSQPLSSVAFQFLVLVVSSSRSCNQKPKFIVPTPSSGSRIIILPGGKFTTELRADSGYYSLSITEIQIAGPIGLKKGGLQRIGSTNDYYVIITWLPHINQTDMTHHFCFIAINSAGVGSDQSCILLESSSFYLMPYAEKISVFLHNVIFLIRSNTTVNHFHLEACISNITFLEYDSDIAVYSIRSSSSEVTFDNSTQMTIRPNYMFTDGTTYYIKFGFNCTLYQQIDKTLWTFEVTGKLLCARTVSW